MQNTAAKTLVRTRFMVTPERLHRGGNTLTARRKKSQGFPLRTELRSRAAEKQTIGAAAHVAQIRFVAALQLDDGAAGIAYFREGLAHCRPVHVAIAEVNPGVSVVFALEVLEVHIHDVFAQGANPVLRVAVKHHVADVEPGLDPRALEL